jgi:hypothetical protein
LRSCSLIPEQNEHVPINFELPNGHGLPRNTMLETYPYTDDEIRVLTPFSGPGFNFMFRYLCAPSLINHNNASEHITEFRKGMEFLVRVPFSIYNNLANLQLLASLCRRHAPALYSYHRQNLQFHPPGHETFSTTQLVKRLGSRNSAFQ